MGVSELTRRYPFWTYYVLAVSFPVLLYTYLAVAFVVAQQWYGPDYNLMAEYVKTRTRIIEAHPALSHHWDGIPTVLMTYAAFPLAAPFLFFPFAPTVSALTVTALARGKAALRSLLTLYRPVLGGVGWGEGARVYGALIAFIALFFTLLVVGETLLGDPERAGRFARQLGIVDVQVFLGTWIVALFLNQGALLEELGWRGYVLPMFVKRFQYPLKAALILGVAWALWHSPRDVFGLLTGQAAPGQTFHFLALFIPSCCAASVVMTYFVNRTGGSVLPAIMIHGMFNLMGSVASQDRVGTRTDFTFYNPAVWIVAAAVVVALAGSDLGWKRRLEAHGGDGRGDPSRAWVS